MEPTDQELTTKAPSAKVTTLDSIYRRSGYQALTTPQRPDYWGIDHDLSRRPGWPRMHEPVPLPNSRWPIEQQPGESASPKHGRPNKRMTPVFGTSTPLKGLSGAVRRYAYSMPDHFPSHWLTMMLGDRIEFIGYRARKVLPFVAPLFVIGLGIKAFRARH